jgi:hypothetical protein
MCFLISLLHNLSYFYMEYIVSDFCSLINITSYTRHKTKKKRMLFGFRFSQSVWIQTYLGEAGCLSCLCYSCFLSERAELNSALFTTTHLAKPKDGVYSDTHCPSGRVVCWVVCNVFFIILFLKSNMRFFRVKMMLSNKNVEVKYFLRFSKTIFEYLLTHWKINTICIV